MNLHVNRNTHLDWDHFFTQPPTAPVGPVPLQITILLPGLWNSSHLLFMIQELFIWSGTPSPLTHKDVIMHESYWSDQKKVTTSLPPHILLFSRSLTVSHTVPNSIHQQAQCPLHPCNQTQCLQTCTSILLHQHAPDSHLQWLWMNSVLL